LNIMLGRVWLVPLLATTMVQTVIALNLFALPVLATRASADIGLDPSWVGLYSSIVFGGSILSSLTAGAPVRRWGPVRIGQLCLVLGALAALFAASGSLPLLIAAALMLGLAFGPETPAASHLLKRVTTPRNRPLVFSIKQTGIQLGGIGAGLLFPLLALSLSWQAVLIATGALSLIGVAILQPLRSRYDTDKDPLTPLRAAALGQAVKLVVGTDALRRLAISGFCFSALQQCVNTFLVVHLVRNLGEPLAVAGVALAVAQIAGVACRIASGVVADRLLSTRWLLVWIGAIMTIAAVGLAAARVEWPSAAVLGVCALLGLSATGWQGIYLAEVARLAPPNRASDATGGILVAAYGGLLSGPLVFGALVGTGVGYAAGYLIMAIVTLLGTAAVAIRPVRVAEAEPAE
jgi:MFS family permease